MRRALATILFIGVLAQSRSRAASPIHTYPLPRPNPTSYSFALPLDKLRDAAWNAFSIEHQTKQPIFGRAAPGAKLLPILFPECSSNAVFGAAIFQNPANTNDIFLQSLHDPFIVSSVYRGRSGGLPFIATLHLHLSAAGTNTAVTITASDAQVINGRKFGFGSCGLGFAWNYQTVKPTTIEEYSILKYLGTYLGITNMPAVLLPER